MSQSSSQAVEKIHELAVSVNEGADDSVRREMLMKCAATAMSSKLIHQVRFSRGFAWILFLQILIIFHVLHLGYVRPFMARLGLGFLST